MSDPRWCAQTLNFWWIINLSGSDKAKEVKKISGLISLFMKATVHGTHVIRQDSILFQLQQISRWAWWKLQRLHLVRAHQLPLRGSVGTFPGSPDEVLILWIFENIGTHIFYHNRWLKSTTNDSGHLVQSGQRTISIQVVDTRNQRFSPQITPRPVFYHDWQ